MGGRRALANIALSFASMALVIATIGSAVLSRARPECRDRGPPPFQACPDLIELVGRELPVRSLPANQSLIAATGFCP